MTDRPKKNGPTISCIPDNKILFPVSGGCEHFIYDNMLGIHNNLVVLPLHSIPQVLIMWLCTTGGHLCLYIIPARWHHGVVCLVEYRCEHVIPLPVCSYCHSEKRQIKQECEIL